MREVYYIAMQDRNDCSYWLQLFPWRSESRR